MARPSLLPTLCSIPPRVRFAAYQDLVLLLAEMKCANTLARRVHALASQLPAATTFIAHTAHGFCFRGAAFLGSFVPHHSRPALPSFTTARSICMRVCAWLHFWDRLLALGCASSFLLRYSPGSRFSCQLLRLLLLPAGYLVRPVLARLGKLRHAFAGVQV